MGRGLSLFLIFSVGLFLFLNLAFPPFADKALSYPLDSAINGLAAGQASGIVFLVVEILALVLLALLLSWSFRRLAEMTDSAGVCRSVLSIGALITAGHLLILLWSGFDTGSQSMLLQRVVLSAWIVAISGAAANAAFRYGPEPESRLEAAGFGA